MTPLEATTVSFAGTSVTIAHDGAAQPFLSLLFGDMAEEAGAGPRHLSLRRDGNGYLLAHHTTVRHHGPLDVRMAARLYDAVIFDLLNEAKNGIALHAGAVVRDGRTMLLPGRSGAGKSTLTAWLAWHGCRYLTDELLFISFATPGKPDYFSRPACLKPGSAELIAGLLGPAQRKDMLFDEHGAIIPRHLLNPCLATDPAAPALIVLPEYRANAAPALEPVGKAHLATLLMGCHANARNLADHGFRQVIAMARATPAWRLRFSSLREVEPLLERLLDG